MLLHLFYKNLHKVVTFLDFDFEKLEITLFKRSNDLNALKLFLKTTKFTTGNSRENDLSLRTKTQN